MLDQCRTFLDKPCNVLLHGMARSFLCSLQVGNKASKRLFLAGWTVGRADTQGKYRTMGEAKITPHFGVCSCVKIVEGNGPRSVCVSLFTFH